MLSLFHYIFTRIIIIVSPFSVSELKTIHGVCSQLNLELLILNNHDCHTNNHYHDHHHHHDHHHNHHHHHHRDHHLQHHHLHSLKCERNDLQSHFFKIDLKICHIWIVDSPCFANISRTN